jgi:hypothetical protein
MAWEGGYKGKRKGGSGGKGEKRGGKKKI